VLVPALVGAAEGVFLHLMTQSFAVRALLGSLAATALACAAVRWGFVRSSSARRLLVLAPVLSAAGAAVASVGDGFLPQIMVATSGATPADRLLDLVGVAVSQRELGILFVAYAIGATTLCVRRALGVAAARRIVAHARPATDERLLGIAGDLAARMQVPPLRVLQLPGCPGGAFTVGTRKPVVVVDTPLLHALDDRELEGLVAHELAHIRRRDALLGQVVGVARDLAFFLPPLHLAARWLRSEQEETADECAAVHTRRPAALASSILKVWDCSRQRPVLPMTCAATGSLRLAPVGAPLVAARVERLIGAPPALSALRRRAEFALAAGIVAVALTAAVVVPSYVAVDHQVDALSFGYLRPAAEGPVESPAFATFRALTPPAAVPADGTAPEVDLPVAGAVQVPRPCPCVESPAQLHQRHGATEPPRSHSWSADGVAPYTFRPTDAAARELWTLSESGPQLGVFLVTRPR
jgi:Zn-dependent protease with chaperone function